MKVTKIFINEGKENYSHFKGDTGKLVNKDTELNEVKIKKYISDVNKDRIAIKKYISNVSKEKEKHIRCCKKRKITKSLINNKAYFKVKNNKIELIAKSNESLSRTEWLMSFSNWNNNCINKQLIKKEAFEYYEKFYFINNDIEFIKDLNQKNLFCVYKNTINEYEKNALKKYLKDNKIDLKENITKNYVFLITKYLKANNEEREKNKKLKNIKESEKEVLKNIDKEKVIEDLENYFYYMTEVRDYMDKIFTKGRIHKLNSNDCINKIDNIKKSIRNHIRGKVVNKIILQGKILAYYGNEEEKLITTKELEEIKIKESIKKQFINSVYFANSKLANLINYTGDKDVLEKEYLLEEEYKNLEDNVKKRYIAIKNFN